MLFIGTKFYRYIDEELEIVRLVKYYNDTEVSIRNEKTKEVRKITIKELTDNYIKISINGLLTFAKVTVGNGNNDVIVSLYRDKELDMKSKLPYCVCRQGIVDIFYQLYNPNINLYGASVSIETVPVNIDFDIMVACDGVDKDSVQYVAVYINDTIDTIMDLIKTEKYDRTLNLMFLDHLQNESKKYGKMWLQSMLKERDECHGYVKTLRSLLETTNFMFDFYKGYNIHHMDFDLSDLDQQALPDNYKQILSNLICKNIDKALVIKYDHDVQLSLIKKDYILILDKNQELYIIIFTTNGIFHIPVEQMVDVKGIETLYSKMNTPSVQSAYEHIIINKDKYSKL